MRRHLLVVFLMAALLAFSALAGAAEEAQAQPSNATSHHDAESDAAAESVCPGLLLAAVVIAMSPAGMPPYPCTPEREGLIWWDEPTGSAWQCQCYWNGNYLNCYWHNRPPY